MQEKPNLNVYIPENFRKVAEKHKIEGERLKRYNLLVGELMSILGDKAIDQLDAEEDMGKIREYRKRMKQLLEFVNVKSEILFEFELNGNDFVEDTFIESRRTFSVVVKDYHNDIYEIVDEAGVSIGEQYKEVTGGVEVDGENFFSVERSNGKASIINDKGQDHSTGSFESLDGPLVINGELFYCGENADTGEFEVHINDEIFIVPDVTRYDTYYEVDGRIFYQFSNDVGKKTIVNEDGGYLPNDYVRFDAPIIVDSILISTCQDDNGDWSVVDQNGRKYGGLYCDVGNITDVGGRVAFRARLKGANEDILFYDDGLYVGGRYKRISAIIDINGNPVIKATDRRTLNSAIYNHEGTPFTEEYSSIKELKAIGGEFFFTAFKSNGKWVVMNKNQEEIGGEFDDVGSLYNSNGRLFFYVKKGDVWSFINEDGDEIASDLKLIYGISTVEGKFFAEISSANHSYVMMNEKGEYVGGEFQEVCTPVSILGEVVFEGQSKEGLWRIYDSEGKPISGEYTEIIKIKEIDGKAYFVGVREGAVEKVRFMMDV